MGLNIRVGLILDVLGALEVLLIEGNLSLVPLDYPGPHLGLDLGSDGLVVGRFLNQLLQDCLSGACLFIVKLGFDFGEGCVHIVSEGLVVGFPGEVVLEALLGVGESFGDVFVKSLPLFCLFYEVSSVGLFNFGVSLFNHFCDYGSEFLGCHGYKYVVSLESVLELDVVVD